MNKVEDPNKKSGPQLVKLDRSFKLAEQWVNNMSKPSGNERLTVVELEGRPSRLGIGATVPRDSPVARLSSNDPIERALLSKLHTDKRKAIKRDEDLETSTKGRSVDEDSEEDETESKTKAFSKKRRPLSLISPLQAKKKHR